MKTRFTPILLGLAMLAGSCASPYNAIMPEAIQYDYLETSPDGLISMGYQYDVLAKRRNNKYVKREIRNSIKVVAVKVVNNSSEPVHVGRDARLFMGNREVIPMEPNQVADVVKQGVPIYLLYSLLNFTIGATKNQWTGELEGGTFLPTGPIIAAGNIITAASANSKFRKELVGTSIMNKTIGPGETAYGTLSLRESTSGPLKLQFKN